MDGRTDQHSAYTSFGAHMVLHTFTSVSHLLVINTLLGRLIPIFTDEDAKTKREEVIFLERHDTETLLSPAAQPKIVRGMASTPCASGLRIYILECLAWKPGASHTWCPGTAHMSLIITSHQLTPSSDRRHASLSPGLLLGKAPLFRTWLLVQFLISANDSPI